MRSVSLLLLTTFLLSSCGQGISEPVLTSSYTATSTPPAIPPTLTNSPPAPPEQSAATSTQTIQQNTQFPSDRPLLAFETSRTQRKTLALADPAENFIYEFRIPAAAHSATPFLAGLSPDASYLVYFEGGQIETLYEVDHLRATEPALTLHVVDLRSGENIFSTHLLSPSFPQDLAAIAETIKDEWHFTFQNASFDDVITATQEMLLDYIRNVAWSPDGSLLAYASQNPGPSSDLYFFNLANRTARQVSTDPGHILKMNWAPDSSALVVDTSLFDRHAREDTTYLLSRDGVLQGSFTSQIWRFHNWHDPKTVLLYGATDAGDYFELKAFSAVDGTISMIWEGSWGDIAFSDDLSTFLVSSFIPSAPVPPRPGLFLGNFEDGSLVTLSENKGWGVAFWGSERFAFAASSIDEGTIGITPDGEIVPIDDGYWRFDSSPNGTFLAGYNRVRPGSIAGILPGLRIFDGSGQLVEEVVDANITCIHWNADSTALAYQVDNRLYLWDARSGATQFISGQLTDKECAFKWVGETP